MKKTRHAPNQIITKLGKVEAARVKDTPDAPKACLEVFEITI